jgi:hypothetical protein
MAAQERRDSLPPTSTAPSDGLTQPLLQDKDEEDDLGGFGLGPWAKVGQLGNIALASARQGTGRLQSAKPPCWPEQLTDAP